AHLGQLAFRQIRIVVEQRFGGHEPEHGVAEEFEALIGGDPTGLEGEGTMCERETKSLGINVDPETLPQFCCCGVSVHSLRRQRPCGPCTRGTAGCRRRLRRPWPGGGASTQRDRSPQS